MKQFTVLTVMIGMLFLLLAACGHSNTTVSEAPSATLAKPMPKDGIDKSWTFQKTSVHGKNPLAITLRVTGTASTTPFERTVTVTDSEGATLFFATRNDRDIDQFFGEEGFYNGCTGYQECKNKWYFEELPEIVENALVIVDRSSSPAEDWEHEILADLAGRFLEDKGLPTEQRAAVLNEMRALLSAQYDSLHIPEDPNSAGASHMYVPSLALFVPYFHS